MPANFHLYKSPLLHLRIGIVQILQNFLIYRCGFFLIQTGYCCFQSFQSLIYFFLRSIGLFKNLCRRIQRLSISCKTLFCIVF